MLKIRTPKADFELSETRDGVNELYSVAASENGVFVAIGLGPLTKDEAKRLNKAISNAIKAV